VIEECDGPLNKARGYTADAGVSGRTALDRERTLRLLPHSLRYRVPVMILAVSLTIAAVFLYGLSRIIFSSFVSVERSEVVKDTERAALALDATLKRLSGSAADWARWTDVYEFVAGRAPQFPRENIDSSTFANLNADLIVFCDHEGAVIWTGAADTASGEVGALSPSLVAALRDSIDHMRPVVGSDRAGIVSLAGNATLFATHLITNNDGTAPPNGFILLGHTIDVDDAREASTLTGLSVSFSEPAPGATFVGPESAILVSYPDDRTAVGSMLVAGVVGTPALQISVTRTTWCASRANETMVAIGGALLALALVFALTLTVSLQATVLRRLTRLRSRTSLETAGRPSAYSTVRGQDEITGLALALDEAEGRTVAVEGLLRQQADHDPLTGLPNRRTLERDMIKSVAEAARDGGSMTLALCDLDRFKLINDTAGHACGDQVLRWFGEKAQSAMRDYSTVARTGGDEFAILLPHTNASDATLAIARLSELVASEPCRCDAGPITVSASFGMATYPEDAQDPEGLMRVADARMYDDKRARESGTASSLDPHDV